MVKNNKPYLRLWFLFIKNLLEFNLSQLIIEKHTNFNLPINFPINIQIITIEF